MSDESGTEMATAQVSKDKRGLLSPERGAFVIQFRASADVEQGRFGGWVEHVASGEVAHFQTPEQLGSGVREICALRKGE